MREGKINKDREREGEKERVREREYVVRFKSIETEAVFKKTETQ